MAKDRINIRIYGDDADAVYVAPKGTTGPTDLGAPGVGYVEVGWLAEDGVDFDRSETVTDFFGLQGGALVRSKKSSVKDTFKFICLEETATTLGLYYVGATATTLTGVDKYVVTNQSASDERAWVLDFLDGTVHKRAVIPNGEVTGRATVSHKNSAITMYEFTVSVYGDYDIYKTAAV